MSEKTTTLYYRDSRSDKVYTASIDASGDGYVVNIAYGRRGSTLTTGTKTNSPVDLAAAEKIFGKLIREKEAKGYTPGEDGARYTNTAKADRVADYLPMLLNNVDETQARQLMMNGDWIIQEKMDGRRIMVVKNGSDVHGINKLGLTVDLPMSVVGAALEIEYDFVIDGEMIGETHHAFDLLSLNGSDLRSKGYQVRYGALANMLALYGLDRIVIVPTLYRHNVAELRDAGAEGVVLKRSDAPYKAGRPASGGKALKLKFYETCSAVVATHNDKRSINVRLLNDAGHWEAYGSVAIPPNKAIPNVGDVVEIRYLYAYVGSLYQPTYLGVRDDVLENECLVSQIKFKKGVNF